MAVPRSVLNRAPPLALPAGAGVRDPLGICPCRGPASRHSGPAGCQPRPRAAQRCLLAWGAHGPRPGAHPAGCGSTLFAHCALVAGASPCICLVIVRERGWGGGRGLTPRSRIAQAAAPPLSVQAGVGWAAPPHPLASPVGSRQDAVGGAPTACSAAARPTANPMGVLPALPPCRCAGAGRAAAN